MMLASTRLYPVSEKVVILKLIEVFIPEWF